MKRILSGLLIFCFVQFLMPGGLTFASQSKAKSRPAPPALKLVPIKDGLYEVKGGSGANSGLFVGDEEVVAIDAKMTVESAAALISEVKKITDKPLTTILLTHSDGDHVNGLVGFPKGLRIISQQNTRAHINKAFKKDVQRIFLPNLTFAKRLVVYSGKDEIHLLHFGPAHTDGDAVVYFPKQKIAFLGDLLFLGRDPLIHRHKNGKAAGVIKTLKAIAELDVDYYYHGHGEKVDKKVILERATEFEHTYLKVKEMVGQGKSLPEIKKAFNIPEAKSRWTSFVETIYLELTEKSLK